MIREQFEMPAAWQKYVDMIGDSELRRLVTTAIHASCLSHPALRTREPRGTPTNHTVTMYYGHTAIKRDLVPHVVNLCEMIVWYCKTYPDLARDTLLAAALVHDLGHLYQGSVNELDHSFLETCELYTQGFPLEVIHIVASHFGQNGPTSPQTAEARIFASLDRTTAEIESLTSMMKTGDSKH